jgi:uncharacterized Zn finger protein
MPAEFGATPWGRVWLRTVESTAMAAPNPLLPKARSLARNHAVAVTVETNRLVADVTVYRVQIDLPPWSDDKQGEAARLTVKALADNRGLAVGDLPDTLEADFRHHGIGLAVGLDEQVAVCDCRTRKRPCVHILATIYAFSLLVDERPALAIELRSSTVDIAMPGDPDWIPLVDLDPGTFYER